MVLLLCCCCLCTHLLQTLVDRLEQGVLQAHAARRERHGELLDDWLVLIQDVRDGEMEARPQLQSLHVQEPHHLLHLGEAAREAVGVVRERAHEGGAVALAEDAKYECDVGAVAHLMRVADDHARGLLDWHALAQQVDDEHSRRDEEHAAG